MKNIEAPKRKITIEFGSDDFLDAFHATLCMINTEREAMQERHNKLIQMFMQDINNYTLDKFIAKNDKSKQDN